MNRSDRVFTAVAAALLGFCAGAGSAGCWITAFEVPLAEPALWLWVCAGAAVVCALAFSGRWGWLVLAPCFLGGLWLWLRAGGMEQLAQLVSRVSYYYDRVYHWGYWQLGSQRWDAGTADLAVAALGAAAAGTGAWCVCRGGSGATALLMGLIPLWPCVVVTDTVPRALWLWLLLWPVLVLLLSAHARRCHIPSGSRLAAWLALPVGMVLAALFFLVPRDGYVDRTAALRQRLITWGQEIGQQIGQQVSMPQEPDAPAQPSAPQQVDLWDQGQRQESRQPVLYVTAQTGGALYLRGQDYDVYDGRAWHATPHRAEPFAMEGASLGQVTVQTLGLEREVYLPYYPEPGTVLVGGRLENTRLQTEYTCQRRSITQSLDALLEQGAEQTVTSGWPEYLALPEKTRQGLQGYVAGLSGQATDKALAIGQLVRQTASYDLQTERMPQDAEDFALWFLEQSDRGYCVHFATAAVVLLRAAGVEARYVSGYLVNLRPDTRTAVTGEHAHAWAEYYEPALGNWLILEATPGAAQPQPPVAAEGVRPEPQTLPPAQLPQGRPEEDLTIPQGQQPEPSLPAQPQKSRGRSPLPWILAAGLLAAAVLEGQRRLRLSWRNRPRQPNDRALVLWHQAEHLAFCLRRSVPQSLEALALKARFSQHTLTPQELAQMEAYCQTAVRALKDRPWYVRLAARYGFALY